MATAKKEVVKEPNYRAGAIAYLQSINPKMNDDYSPALLARAESAVKDIAKALNK